jgi:RNA recognition motif-containing protein
MQRSAAVKKLYIGNLPYQCTEDSLREWFSSAGFSAGEITVVRDRMTGQSRGFGFVEFSSEDDAARAMQQLNGKDMMGRRLVINPANPPRQGDRGPRRDRGDRSGGGGGRGRGGFGGGGDRGGYGGGGYEDR